MGSKQVCEWVCDLCSIIETSYSEHKLPRNWCQARVELVFNGGRRGQGVISEKDSYKTGTIDVCSACYDDQRKAARFNDETIEVSKSLTKRLMNFFGIISTDTLIKSNQRRDDERRKV